MIDENVFEENDVEEVVEKSPIKDEQIQKIRKIKQKNKDIFITPPRPHLVDISVVQSETTYNIIGSILITIGSLFFGIFYASPEKSITLSIYLSGSLLIFGIIIYVYGKIYLYKKIHKDKISLDEYYGEE